MAIGSLATAGTLGIMIPPSIIMVVYAVAAEVSIVRVFIAGMIPGMLVMGLFSGYIAVWSLMNPSQAAAQEPPMPFLQKLRAKPAVDPVRAADHRGDGQHLPRLGDGDGSGGLRRDRRAGPVGLGRHAELADPSPTA